MSEVKNKKETVSQNSPKIVVLASGGGTNFQEIIDQIESGQIDANIVGLISDNPDAKALERARNHKIPPILISSVGRSRKDSPERKQFENDVFETIKGLDPHLVVLAGWMKVLSDDFLNNMENLDIPIINLHPALLTEGNDNKITTSRGEFEVLRGAHAIEDAFNRNYPVSGVTVHQVVPGPFDAGPIIIQEEVLREAEDTLEIWEAKIHQTEYRLLPKAINIVIHTMSNG